jgi:hypothetical protein
MSGSVADNIDRQSGVIAEPAGGPEVRSDDPSASAGTVWFNTTSGVLKVFRNVTAWSTENNMLTAAWKHGGCGTITAGLSMGGQDASAKTTETEEWDGTSWVVSGVGNLATATANGANFGTQTAAVYAGGQSAAPAKTNRTEEYDGSTWSAGGDLQESQNDHAGFGTLTAGVRFGGEN